MPPIIAGLGKQDLQFLSKMMKKIWLFTILILPSMAFAQFDDFSDQSDFNAFQQKIEQQYRDYQDTINRRFVKELARQWEEYEMFQGNPRPQKPKPREPIMAPKESVPKLNNELPVGNIVQPVDVLQQSIFPQGIPENESVQEPFNIQREISAEETMPNFEKSYNVSIDFYQQPLTLSLPVTYTEISISDISEKSVANLWKQFSQNDVSGYVSQCQTFKQQYNYNDWAVYEMICDFARSSFPKQYEIQTVFSVFLLNQLGIDAQIGRKLNRLVVLLPVQTTIYAVPYIKHNGVNYYIFSLYPEKETSQSSIFTYNVKYSGNEKAMDLHIKNPIRLPYKSAHVTYKTDYWNGDSENLVPLNLNQNVLDFYARYPQVDMTVYSTAQMTQELMDWVEKQIVPTLSEVNPKIAVSLLLDYIQHGFDYATDGEQFGFEKPFFCEENFYYAKNDCEDRAILMSYFIRNFVDADIVLLDYPDHIATAVAFFDDSEVLGDYYLLNGKKYFVCDPTYIGAGIGETMPQYIDSKPNVIFLENK